MKRKKKKKPLNCYNPHDEVLSLVSQNPYPFTIPHTQLIVHPKGKEYMR